MLSAVLNSEVAIEVSIRIMNAFVAMRHFIASNEALFERMNAVELRQLEYQKSTDEKFDKVFRYIEDHAESEQKIFFDGQIYDAFGLMVSIIRKAQIEIILIDGYAGRYCNPKGRRKQSGFACKLYLTVFLQQNLSIFGKYP